ncbi:hypothetical protein PORCRE_1825 [Porphyromonas crevioricanis JCM 15906]|uniref:Uncharacterized protein n=1 Tax=Porphyromonas crevioricanis JCM 15906 TaxID=1305617 RepID=T1CSH8_9PORP|nr:hypothetical protein PORCRE_1825 [Porphyromonas crevioricanis JCM 15906]
MVADHSLLSRDLTHLRHIFISYRYLFTNITYLWHYTHSITEEAHKSSEVQSKLYFPTHTTSLYTQTPDTLRVSSPQRSKLAPRDLKDYKELQTRGRNRGNGKSDSQGRKSEK